MTGQRANESFWRRLISVEETHVPMRFPIPLGAEMGNVQSAIHRDRSDDSGRILDIDKQTP